MSNAVTDPIRGVENVGLPGDRSEPEERGTGTFSRFNWNPQYIVEGKRSVYGGKMSQSPVCEGLRLPDLHVCRNDVRRRPQVRGHVGNRNATYNKRSLMAVDDIQRLGCLNFDRVMGVSTSHPPHLEQARHQQRDDTKLASPGLEVAHSDSVPVDGNSFADARGLLMSR